jgi:hypothetical protein
VSWIESKSIVVHLEKDDVDRSGKIMNHDRHLRSVLFSCQVVTSSHSFNVTMFRAIGEAISTEARAFYNKVRQAKHTVVSESVHHSLRI